jgi:hypothetical protein
MPLEMPCTINGNFYRENCHKITEKNNLTKPPFAAM